MREPNFDKVEIVEPPIGELTKRHGSFTQGCFTGCGFIVLFIIGSTIGLRLLLGTGPSVVKTVPTDFPQNIPVYDKENIEQITYIPGQYKHRGMEIAAFFPKIILSSLILNLNKANDTSTPVNFSTNGFTETWQLITTPVSDDRATTQIEWRDMDAEPNFITTYYSNELEKAHYEVNREKTSNNISFQNDNTISGTLIIKDNDNRPGTDYALLTVNYPSASSTP